MSDYADLKARVSEFADGNAWPSTVQLIVDLAAAIDALERERDKDGEEIIYLKSELDAAKARMKRLREALRTLMMHEPDYPDTVWQEARAALQEDKSHE